MGVLANHPSKMMGDGGDGAQHSALHPYFPPMLVWPCLHQPHPVPSGSLGSDLGLGLGLLLPFPPLHCGFNPIAPHTVLTQPLLWGWVYCTHLCLHCFGAGAVSSHSPHHFSHSPPTVFPSVPGLGLCLPPPALLWARACSTPSPASLGPGSLPSMADAMPMPLPTCFHGPSSSHGPRPGGGGDRPGVGPGVRSGLGSACGHRPGGVAVGTGWWP